MKLVRFLLALMLLWSQPAFAQAPAWVVSDTGGAATLHRQATAPAHDHSRIILKRVQPE
jgi:hypothetical protein